MPWRVHLTNQAIQSLHILPGKQTLLAAWTQRDRATYFDLETGIEVGEHQHKAVSRQSDKWAEFLATLVAPNGAYLPFVRTAQATLFTTDDGKLRLYWMTGDELLLELDGKEVKLELKAKANIIALGLDRLMGSIVALDAKGKLHIFQQHISVGSFDLKLNLDEDSQSSLAIANGGSAIFVSDGREIVLTDTSGKVKKRQGVHYFIGRMVCSPDGKRVVTSDPETGVIRVYTGDDLQPTHQRHALDLLQDAAQLQLIADLPPFNAAPGSLAIDDKGNIAFNISGVVCATTLKQLAALPRPQPLL
ncbi:MAG: hypothetical protein H0X30_11165 [Anaerolineae bacterium]|nr:hypothetical protein [Anaerolineae bacterium]